MTRLGRRASPCLGKRSPTAVFSDDQVRAIRNQYSSGALSAARLGAEYGVGKHCIARMVARKTYADVQ
jgi:hypothetical protein